MRKSEIYREKQRGTDAAGETLLMNKRERDREIEREKAKG